MRSGWIGAVLAALAIAHGSVPARAGTLEERVERMERELKELKAEIRRRDEADRRRAGRESRQPRAETAPPARAPRTATAPAPEPAPGAPGSAKPAPVVTAQTRPERAETPTPTTKLPFTDRVRVGGYGSMRFSVTDNPELKNTFELRRLVLTTDARIAPRLSAYLELEFERFRKLEVEKSLTPAEGGLTAQQAVEGTNESEISLEQVWLQYDIQDWLKFRGGGVLVPLGRFNINHDDNRWDLPRRSLVDRGVPVLPSTAAWDELGMGFLGDVPITEDVLLNYQAYVVNGVSLDFNFEQIAQTRFPEPGKQVIEVELEPQTGTFANDVKNAKAFTGRVAVSPALGHEVGGSWYYGRYTPSFLPDESLWSLAADWKSVFDKFEVEGEYVFTRFGGIRDVATGLARVARDQAVEFENPELESEVEFELANLATTKQGYWLELRYRFWPEILTHSFLGWEFDNPQLVAVLRGEQVWLDGLVEEANFGGGRLVNFETDNRRVDRITVGLAYRPVPLVVFQLAYEWTRTNDGKSLSSVTNFIPGNVDHMNALLIGVAFGF
jgi:hypothetical protein